MIQGHRTRMIRWREPSRAGNALFDWDFTQQSPGALVLPTGLSFARASSGHSVQTGTSTVVTSGITSNDVGRIGRLSSAHNLGLFIEPERTNLISNNRAHDTWTAGSGAVTTADAIAGPDGSVAAERIVVSSGGFSRYQTRSTTPGERYTLSAWQRAVTSSEYRLGLVVSATSWSYSGGPGQALTTSWARKDVTRLIPGGETATVVIPFDGSARASPSVIAAQSCDLYSDFHQLELGRYPSSVILTAGATVTRAAERLTVDSTRCTRALVGGRLGVYLRFRALAAVSELGSADGQILFGVGSGGSIRLAASGYIYADDPASAHWSETATSAVSWSRGDLVEIATEIGAGKFRFSYRVNGGSVVTPALTRDETFDALVLTSGLDVLCAGTSWQMPSILEVLSFFVPGRAPF